jgi:branched-chain amino acid transport system permease protein
MHRIKIKKSEIVFSASLLLLGLTAPWILPSVWTTVLSLFCYYAIVAIGWNIIFGYTGLFSYGHVAFPAIGAYASALLVEHTGLSPFAGLLVAASSAGFVGILIGLLILRVRGFYLCLVTWAFAEVINVVITAEHHITGGTGGFIARSFFNGPHAELYGYFLGLGLMLLTFLVSAGLYHSRFLFLPRLFKFCDGLSEMKFAGFNFDHHHPKGLGQLGQQPGISTLFGKFK